MINSVAEFIEKAGGATALAARLHVHQFTVDRWRKNGIPMKYWEPLIETFGTTPAELYLLNNKILSKKL